MKLRNLRLTMANIARKTNDKTLEVIGTSAIRSKNKDGSYSSDPIGYALECAAYRGDTIKVKFPTTVEADIEQVKELLAQDKLVEVSFTGLKLTAYAMPTDSGYLSGVSAKADSFTIAPTTGSDLDNIDLDMEL